MSASNDREQTALHYAARCVVERMIPDWLTDAACLAYTCSKGNVEVGRLLIERGADINARDKANQLPLCVWLPQCPAWVPHPLKALLWLARRHRAATTGATPFVRLILASESPGSFKKPRLNLQDRAGNTPLHLAMESGHAEVAVAL